MFCDFSRIAPAKMLFEGFPPSPQDRPHSVTAARPADAENFSMTKEKLYANGLSIHIELFPVHLV